jgi:hypothetical protein
MDTMVTKANIEEWTISKVLINGGNSTYIIFTSTVNAMRISIKILQ